MNADLTTIRLIIDAFGEPEFMGLPDLHEDASRTNAADFIEVLPCLLLKAMGPYRQFPTFRKAAIDALVPSGNAPHGGFDGFSAIQLDAVLAFIDRMSAHMDVVDGEELTRLGEARIYIGAMRDRLGSTDDVVTH
jgi:hypothetical protein